jgi:pyridoxal 5'-phosphate synthase pdxT subunit
MLTVGVLALQGDFREHLQALQEAEVRAIPVRTPADLAGVDALVIPGGESTTIRRLLQVYELAEPVRERAAAGLPVYGTCAGCILLAREVDGASAPVLGLMDIGVTRNAYGRQVDSFETDLPVPALGDEPFHAVFIRAPRIDEVGEGIEILARLEDGSVAAARQGNLLVSTFHPELTGDSRFHRYFVEQLVREAGRHLAVR